LPPGVGEGERNWGCAAQAMTTFVGWLTSAHTNSCKSAEAAGDGASCSTAGGQAHPRSRGDGTSCSQQYHHGAGDAHLCPAAALLTELQTCAHFGRVFRDQPKLLPLPLMVLQCVTCVSFGSFQGDPSGLASAGTCSHHGA
jgi:hypothetical protein